MRRSTLSIVAEFSRRSWRRPAVLGQSVVTDIGTLDKETARRPFRQAAVLALRGPQLPDAPVLRRHAPAHVVLDGRRRVRRRLGPADAYRFAKGEEITASSGQRAKLSRPLDFLVVADHSDNMGFFPDLLAGNPEMLADPTGPALVRHDPVRQGRRGRASRSSSPSRRDKFPKALMSLPGTPRLPLGVAGDDQGRRGGERPGPLHRLHRLRVDVEHGRQQPAPQRDLPRRRRRGEPGRAVSRSIRRGSDNPRDLWKWMAAYEEKTGGDVLAIAHNGNLSNGRMFPIIESFTGKPVDREYAEKRAKWERLYEATQIKGDGETHPFLSPNDEFANFERWDKGNLDLSEPRSPRCSSSSTRARRSRTASSSRRSSASIPTSSAWSARPTRTRGLDGRRGGQLLRQDLQLRAEPDARDAPVRQDREGRRSWAGRRPRPATPPSGPTENTREAHLRRDGAPGDLRHDRPAHGRALLRRLGLRRRTTRRPACPASRGYTQGRADGRRPRARGRAGKAPTFLVAALKDPIGANLDRIQIVKGWLDAKGEVAGEGLRRRLVAATASPAPTASCPPVGNTVDVPNATWTNTIGAPELIAVWKDPDFDPAQRAFYYARVHRDPDAALDGLRRQVLRHQDAARRSR